MTSYQFAHWRKAMNWSRRKAGEELGKSERMVAYYEDGGGYTIPRSVELACAALALGIRSYAGPD